MLDSDEFVVGEPAKQRSGRNPGSTVKNNLQFCNGPLSEENLQNSIKEITCKIDTTESFVYTLEVDEDTKELTPFQTNVEIFHNVLCKLL